MSLRVTVAATSCALVLGCGTEPWLGAGPGRLSETTAETSASSESSTGGPGEPETETETGAPPIKFDLSPPADLGAMAEIPADCETAANVESAVGCVFQAVDLDNAPTGDAQQFGVIVSNVQLEGVAKVVAERRQDGEWTQIGEPVEVAALGSETLLLPANHQEGSGLAFEAAYRITSDLPIVAYQFNPIDGQTSFTTDASLLLPTASWDHLYRVVGYPVSAGQDSYVTIVAAVDGTSVEVTPNDPTLAGPFVPVGVAKQPFWIELDAGDVANVATLTQGNDMTGTRVASDSSHPIGVFSGTECTQIELGACDHLEEMLIGLHQWGLEFVAARPPPRQDMPEPTVWQIYASEANTYVQVEASEAVDGIPGAEFWLDEGQTGRFGVTGTELEPGDFVVRANKPIALTAYMTGVVGGEGDPAMVQVSPVEQFLPRYVVLVPPSWNNDYLVITRPPGVVLTIDGEFVDEELFVAVGLDPNEPEWEVARINVDDGVHLVDGLGAAIGVSVVGFDAYDSYAYVGGMGTVILNPSPAG